VAKRLEVRPETAALDSNLALEAAEVVRALPDFEQDRIVSSWRLKFQSEQILGFLNQRSGSEEERAPNRLLEVPIHGEVVIVRSASEDSVPPDSVFLRHVRIKKPDA